MAADFLSALVPVLGGAISGLAGGGSRAQSSSTASNTNTVSFNPVVAVVTGSPDGQVSPVVTGDARSTTSQTPQQITGDPNSRLPSYLPTSSPNTVPLKPGAAVATNPNGTPVGITGLFNDPMIMLLLIGGLVFFAMEEGR